MHSVYKYVLNGEIIYIGKCDTDLDRRLKQHGRTGDNIPKEARDEIKASDIYYIKLENRSMSDVVESELIRRYKPKWNKRKKNTAWSGLPFQEPEWIRYSIQQRRKEEKINRLKYRLTINSYVANIIAYVIDSIVNNEYVLDSNLQTQLILIKCPSWFTMRDYEIVMSTFTIFFGPTKKNDKWFLEFVNVGFREQIIRCVDSIIKTSERICGLTEEKLPEYVSLIKGKCKQFEVMMSYDNISM